MHGRGTNQIEANSWLWMAGVGSGYKLSLKSDGPSAQESFDRLMSSSWFYAAEAAKYVAQMAQDKRCLRDMY